MFATLAMRESPLWQWGAAAVAIGLLSGVQFATSGATYGLGFGSWVLIVFGAILLALSLEPLRKAVLITPIFGAVKSILPKVSRTEQEALDAGTVGWDAEAVFGASGLGQADQNPAADACQRKSRPFSIMRPKPPAR